MTVNFTETSGDHKLVLTQPPATWRTDRPGRQEMTPENVAWLDLRNAWIKQEYSAGQNEEWIALMLQEVGAPLSTARIWQIVTDYDYGGRKAKSKAKSKPRSKAKAEVVCHRRSMVNARRKSSEEADEYARRIIREVVAMRTNVEAEFAADDTLGRLMGGQ